MPTALRWHVFQQTTSQQEHAVLAEDMSAKAQAQRSTVLHPFRSGRDTLTSLKRFYLTFSPFKSILLSCELHVQPNQPNAVAMKGRARKSDRADRMDGRLGVIVESPARGFSPLDSHLPWAGSLRGSWVAGCEARRARPSGPMRPGRPVGQRWRCLFSRLGSRCACLYFVGG